MNQAERRLCDHSAGSCWCIPVPFLPGPHFPYDGLLRASSPVVMCRPCRDTFGDRQPHCRLPVVHGQASRESRGRTRSLSPSEMACASFVSGVVPSIPCAFLYLTSPQDGPVRAILALFPFMAMWNEGSETLGHAP